MTPPEDENNDPVWDLLKESRSIEPSPLFSRNVVREVRKLDSEPADSPIASLFSWFQRPIVLNSALTGAVAAVILVLFLTVWDTPDSGHSIDEPAPVAHVPEEASPVIVNSDADAFDPANEIENLEYLGELMAVTDPAILDDAALADLLF